MNLSLICAMAENRVIGKNNALPWHLPQDLKYFKATTMGHCIIMGRKTWESIGRPLPGRTSIVVTNQEDYVADGAKVVHSLPDAIRLAEAIALIDGSEEAFVIGGAGLYTAAMPYAQRFHLTRVHAVVEGDTQLEEFDENEWTELRNDFFEKDEANPYDYSICVLERQP